MTTILMNNKTNAVYNKIQYILYLIDLLNNKLSINITFDNRVPNKYKLVFRNKEFEFNTYNCVISALKIWCEYELVLYYGLNEIKNTYLEEVSD